MDNFNSKEYWETRYSKGGNSGLGSYGKLAQYKADFINSFIQSKGIKHLIEYGCGDGNNLSLINCEKIIGVDVSKKAVEICKKKMPDNSFHHTSKLNTLEQARLVLSLDVIYHLVEDEVYDNYMKNLCDLSKEYIIVYSSNFDSNDFAQHVRPRKFTDHKYLNEHFELLGTTKNKYHAMNDKQGSFSDWYVFKRKSLS